MTNKERQQARFKRDRKKRLEERLQREREFCNYDKAISIEELTKAFYQCKKGVAWKKSVQNYEMNLFQNISELHRKLDKCEDISRGYVQFYIWERGKRRKIQACHISERVVQKSIANNILTPMLENTLIKNNCASQKGKGTHKAWEYFEEDLKKAYKKWGRDFYVIVHTKEEAKTCLNGIYKIVEELDLEINEKKTRIVKATHVITYLKTKFNLLGNGEVIRRQNRKSITIERKKLKKLKKKLDEGVITFSDVRNSYESWKGSLKGKKCYRTLQNMNKLFNELFIEDWRLEYDE